MLNSLRAKITFGYYLVGALLLAMAGLALLELRLVQDKIEAGAAISEFLDVSLEVRRFEKNFFLYRKVEDLSEQDRYLARARELLHAHASEFAQFAGSARIAELRAEIERYGANMSAYARQVDLPEPSDTLQPLVRQDGKRLIDFAEDTARRERMLLRASLDAHKRNVLLSIGVLVLLIVPVGQIVAQRIARPLKDLEQHMEQIAQGSREPLPFSSGDREMVSLNLAFAHMLDELDLRRKHMVQSERLASLGTMLSGVAHELNNPLSNISTTAQIMLEEHGRLDAAEQRSMLVQIDEQTERARRIVRALLDFARDRPLLRAPTSLRELVGQTLGFLKGQIAATVRVDVDIDATLQVDCDHQRLQQVLINLVRNAADAVGGSGQIRIEARRRAGDAAHADAGVEIDVVDTGPGIAAEVLPHVFDPFFTTKDVGRGSGLGLFVAYEIVEEHGGELTVQSRPGAGARFRIHLYDKPRTDA